MAVGMAEGFQLGLESARRRRLEEEDRSLALEDRTRRHRAQDVAMQADELSLAQMRRADAREPDEIERRRERDDFGFERDRVQAGREDELYASQMQQEGIGDFVHALRSGVEPGFALSQFNSRGKWKIDPRSFRYDPTTGGMEFVDSDGERFAGQLEQLEAAVGIQRQRAEPIKLGEKDRLIEPGTYRELVGPRAGGDDDQRERKIRSLTERGIARSRAEDIVDRNVDIEIVPQTGTARLVDRINNSVEEIPLGAGDREPHPGAAAGRTLWDLALHGTGPISGVAAGVSVPSGMVGGPVAEQTTQARQMLRLETQNLIRSLAINPRFPVAEMERLRSEISLEPRLLDNPDLMRQRMIAIDEGLRRRLAQAERDAADPSLPRDSRESQAQNASVIRNFLPVLGVPASGDVDVDEVELLPGFDELSPAEQDELRRLSRER